MFCGRPGRERAIEKLEDLKRSEHRMDNRLSREEWTDCFMEVRRGVGRLTPSTRCLCATAWRSNHHPRPRLMNTSRIDGVKAPQRQGRRDRTPIEPTQVWREKEMRRQLLLDPKPPKRKKQPLMKGQVQHVVKKDEWEPPPRAHCPPTQTTKCVSHAKREQASKIGVEDAPAGQTPKKKVDNPTRPGLPVHEFTRRRRKRGTADRPKVEMGNFFDLGNEKATAAAKKAKKVEEEKKAPKKKAKVATFGPGGGTKMKTTVKLSKARFSGNASVGSTQTRASRISVPSLKGAGGDLNLRWDMSVATGSFGGGRSVASRGSSASVTSRGSSSSRRPKSAGASLGSSRSRRSRVALAPASAWCCVLLLVPPRRRRGGPGAVTSGAPRGLKRRRSSRRATMDAWPCCFAMDSGVSPSLSALLTSAPLSSNSGARRRGLDGRPCTTVSCRSRPPY